MFIDAFSDAAGHYASNRPTYPSALFDALASLAPARDCAWDVGTGNGQAALALAEHFETVVATDASEAQIAEVPLHPRVRRLVAPAERVDLSAGSVDLVCAAQSAHWFDLPAFYAEVRRVARPGAIVALFGYDWFYVAPEIDALTESHLLQPIASYWSPTNRLLWDGYRTIEFPFEELPRIRLAIHRAWTLAQLFDYLLTWSSVRRKVAAEGDGFLREARERFQASWGDNARSRHVVMPLNVRVGRLV